MDSRLQFFKALFKLQAAVKFMEYRPLDWDDNIDIGQLIAKIENAVNDLSMVELKNPESEET